MRAPNQRHLEDPATDAGHFLFRLGLAVLVMALPVASTLSRRLMFTLLPVGALMMIAGVMLATREPVLRNLRRALSAPASLAGLVLLVWIAASMFWTPFPAPSGGRAFKTFATIALIVIVIAAMPRHTRTSNLYLAAFGTALAALVAIALALLRPLAHVPLELEANLPERAGLMLTILVWPALGALAVRQRMGIAGLLAAAIVGAAIAVVSVVALIALGAGAPTLFWRAGCWARCLRLPCWRRPRSYLQRTDWPRRRCPPGCQSGRTCWILRACAL